MRIYSFPFLHGIRYINHSFRAKFKVKDAHNAGKSLFLCKRICMKSLEDIILPEGCQLLTLPIIADERGFLTFCENSDSVLPFSIKRTFWIYGVPNGKKRGGHAHMTCSEVIFPVSGSFQIEVDNGTQRATVQMNKPNVGIHVPAGMWCNLFDFSSDAVCLVLASHTYDNTGYIHDYQEYIKLKG